MKLFVNNFPYSTTDKDLRDIFAPYGEAKVRVLYECQTRRPRGFAFVELASEEEAKRAISELHGAIFGGREFHVRIAEDRQHKA